MDDLKGIMGDAYKEGITIEEVNEFFKGKKFVDSTSGNYVDKNKHDREVGDLQKKLEQAQNDLKDKMSDDEKANADVKAKDDEITRLTNLLKETTINGNKNSVIGTMNSTRDLLGLKENDKDFTKLIDDITSEDTDKSLGIANYISKITKDAYEKGKQDATKDAMGEFGKSKSGSSDNPDADSLGKRLAEQSKASNTFDYFK